MSKLIHRTGQEREDRIISGKTNLTVAAIFLIDENWKVFKEYRDITGKPLRPEETEEVGWLIWSDLCLLCLCFWWFYLAVLRK